MRNSFSFMTLFIPLWRLSIWAWIISKHTLNFYQVLLLKNVLGNASGHPGGWSSSWSSQFPMVCSPLCAFLLSLTLFHSLRSYSVHEEASILPNEESSVDQSKQTSSSIPWQLTEKAISSHWQLCRAQARWATLLPPPQLTMLCASEVEVAQRAALAAPHFKNDPID